MENETAPDHLLPLLGLALAGRPCGSVRRALSPIAVGLAMTLLFLFGAAPASAGPTLETSVGDDASEVCGLGQNAFVRALPVLGSVDCADFGAGCNARCDYRR
jgi:hypothetical protein